MKICVTGATGYIGSSLTKKLASQGHEVHVLVRSLEKANRLGYANIIFVKGDILQKEDLYKVMKGCTQVYHLAALAKVWTKQNNDFFDVNVSGTKNVLDTAISCHIDRIVVCSTAGVLGASINGAISESSVRCCDFFNEYEGSKAVCESLVKDYVIQKDLDIVIASPTRVYGPCLIGNPESVTYLIERYVNRKWRIIPGKGEKIANYVFIDDVVEGLLLAMEKGIKGHNYILGGSNHSLNDFFNTLKKVSSINNEMYRVPIWCIALFAQFQYFLAENFNIQPLMTPKWIAKTKYHWNVSSEKAQRDLGLKVTSLETGLQRTVDWLKDKKLKEGFQA